jgi:S-formylglutathione hydrolase FrmB
MRSNGETLSRRAVLGAAAGGVLLAACDDGSSGQAIAVPATPRGTRGGLVSGTFVSGAMRGRRLGWGVCYPPGSSQHDRLPVCLVLHGRGRNWRSTYDELALGHYLTVAARGRPFALASVDAGDHSYYHPRRNGTDAQAMLLDEYLPRLAARGLQTDRVAVMGWSMGGYGALLLAEKLGPDRIAAVAADSPALWLRPGQTAPGAFDDAADYRRHDVFAGRPRLAGIPVRVAIGTSDPFVAATHAFVRQVPDLAAAVFRPGGHTGAFWRRTAPAQLAFVARHLTL